MPQRKTTNDFAKLRLDGTAVEWCWAQLVRRIKALLARAVDRKRQGIGAFARPEADVALIQLMAILHQLEPKQGWLDAALLTYAWTLDDALRRAPEIWWGHDWSDPAKEGYPLDWTMIGALLREPTSVNVAYVRIAQFLDPLGESPVPSKPGRDAKKWRRLLYDALSRRLELASSLFARPDRSFPRVVPQAPSTLPNELSEPLWRNERFASITVGGVKQLRRMGHVLMRQLSMALPSQAAHVVNFAPVSLGLRRLPDGYDQYASPHLKHFLDCGPFCVATNDVLGAPVLDRILGAPAGELLRAVLGASRLMAHLTKWSLPYSPGWLHVQEWDSALLSLLVNDEKSLRIWVEQIGVVEQHSSPGTRACNAALRGWVTERRWPDKIRLPKTLQVFESGFLEAMRGLCDGSPRSVDRGVRQMLQNYHRVQHRDTRGKWLSDLCLQAVAIQRGALRSGLKIGIPEEPPNDPELVTGNDPVEASLPWCPLPGIDLVGNWPLDKCPLEWPSLYLGQPVSEVVEPM